MSTICILRNTSKLIEIYKKSIPQNEYINSFENKSMIPYDCVKHNLSKIKKEDLLTCIRFRLLIIVHMYDDNCNNLIFNLDGKLKLTVIHDIKE